MLPWVQRFNPYDLYSKSANRPKVEDVKPYYEELIREYFPEKIAW
jgi:inositol oxygenase